MTVVITGITQLYQDWESQGAHRLVITTTTMRDKFTTRGPPKPTLNP